MRESLAGDRGAFFMTMGQRSRCLLDCRSPGAFIVAASEMRGGYYRMDKRWEFL